MGWGFRKSKKILPGVRVSLTHRGVGVRVGHKNAGVSVTPTGARVSGSIPGTGISVRKELGSKRKRSAQDNEQQEFEIHYLEEERPQPSKIISAILLPIYLVGFLVFAGLGLAAVLQPETSIKVLGGVFWIIALVCGLKTRSRLKAFG